MTPLGRIAYTTLVAFIASLLTLLAVHVLVPREMAGEAPEPGDIREVDAAQLSRHGDAQDCWMAIHGRVYDVTEYLPRHPTPIGVLTPYCGTDATEGWDTKGIGRPHSARAHAMLEEYGIGMLDGQTDGHRSDAVSLPGTAPAPDDDA